MKTGEDWGELGSGAGETAWEVLRLDIIVRLRRQIYERIGCPTPKWLEHSPVKIPFSISLSMGEEAEKLLDYTIVTGTGVMVGLMPKGAV